MSFYCIKNKHWKMSMICNKNYPISIENS